MPRIDDPIEFPDDPSCPESLVPNGDDPIMLSLPDGQKVKVLDENCKTCEFFVTRGGSCKGHWEIQDAEQREI